MRLQVRTKVFFSFLFNVFDPIRLLIIFLPSFFIELENEAIVEKKAGKGGVKQPLSLRQLSLDPNMFLQYKLSLPDDVVESTITDPQILLENLLKGKSPSLESVEKLVLIVQLPSGSTIKQYKIASSGESIEIMIENHKLMWHPQAIHLAVMNGGKIDDKIASKRGVLREAALTEAIKRHDHALSASISKREKILLVDLDERVDRNADTFVSIHNYGVTRENKLQLAFGYFEMAIMKVAESHTPTPDKIEVGEGEMQFFGRTKSSSSGSGSGSATSSSSSGRSSSSGGGMTFSSSGTSRSSSDWQNHCNGIRAHYESRLEFERKKTAGNIENLQDRCETQKQKIEKAKADRAKVIKLFGDKQLDNKSKIERLHNEKNALKEYINEAKIDMENVEQTLKVESELLAIEKDKVKELSASLVTFEEKFEEEQQQLREQMKQEMEIRMQQRLQQMEGEMRMKLQQEMINQESALVCYPEPGSKRKRRTENDPISLLLEAEKKLAANEDSLTSCPTE